MANTGIHMLNPTRRRKPRKRSAKVRPSTKKSWSVTATRAKNQFGQLLERAITGEHVYITRHNVPKAVLISVRDFQALSSRAKTTLNTLSGEFDSLLALMQGSGSRAAIKTAFNASPEQLGIAAVQAAKKRD